MRSVSAYRTRIWISPVSIVRNLKARPPWRALRDSLDEPDPADREEHEHRLAQHQPLGHGAPPPAVGALGAVVAQAHVVVRLDVEDVGLRLVGAHVAAGVVHVAVQPDVPDGDLALGPDA